MECVRTAAGRVVASIGDVEQSDDVSFRAGLVSVEERHVGVERVARSRSDKDLPHAQSGTICRA